MDHLHTRLDTLEQQMHTVTRQLRLCALSAALMALVTVPGVAWSMHETTEHNRICTEERPTNPDRLQEWIALCASWEVFVSNRQECLSVPNCTSVAAHELANLAGDEVHTVEFTCPAEVPHFWNWDAEHHRNVGIDVVAVHAHGVALRLSKQYPEKAGDSYQIFLGCSPEPFAGGGQLHGKHFGPAWAPPGELPGALPTCNDPVNPVCVQICAGHPEIPDCVDALTPKYRLETDASITPQVQCPAGYFNACQYAFYRSSSWVSVTDGCLALDLTSWGFLIINWNAFYDHSAQLAIACTTDQTIGDDCVASCATPPPQ